MRARLYRARHRAESRLRHRAPLAGRRLVRAQRQVRRGAGRRWRSPSSSTRSPASFAKARHLCHSWRAATTKRPQGYLRTHRGRPHVLQGLHLARPRLRAAGQVPGRHPHAGKRPRAGRRHSQYSGRHGTGLRAGRGAGRAREILGQLEQMRADAYVPSTRFAVVHLGLGEHDRALDWLENGCRQHELR